VHSVNIGKGKGKGI